MNKEIEKIYADEDPIAIIADLVSKLNELIEVVNSLIKDEEETKPKGKTK